MHVFYVFLLAAVTGLGVACGGSSPPPAAPDGGGPFLDGGFVSNDDAGPLCTPRTCAQQGVECGPTGDGCGAVLQCGTCPAPTTCGGGGVPSKCGGASACVPKTSQDCPANGCGILADGCGGSVACGACAAPDTCGGGGVPGVCGRPPCTPRTCAQIAPKACGPQADGCGGVIPCGACTAPETCGGDPATPGQCGAPPVTDAGTPVCVPKTCASFPANACGRQSDGCGGLTPDCGTCTAPQTCGGGGATPGLCSGSFGCVPLTSADCAARGVQCGPMSDGCGGTVACGTCPQGQQCGSPTQPSVCWAPPPPCVPTTCAALGMNCGFTGDGCGGLLNCWPNPNQPACPSGQTCGGGGNNVCGGTVATTDAGTFVSCPNGGTTTVRGKVVVGTDPTRFAVAVAPDPVPNAVVFVPSTSLATIADGATCDACVAPAGALSVASTAVDGTFTLSNVPAGARVPIVVQLGKWRRVKHIVVTACAENRTIDDNVGTFRLPRTNADGDAGTHVPKFAIATGTLDGLECVLRKMGLPDGEFGNGGSGRRVEVYRSNGARVDASTPTVASLIDNAATLRRFDAVLMPCEGQLLERTPAQLKNVVDYANTGGRLFATHFSYTYLYDTYTQITPANAAYGWGNSPKYVAGQAPPVSPNSSNTTALWAISDYQANGQSTSATIDETFPKGRFFAAWLRTVGAGVLANGATTVSITDARSNTKSIVAPGQQWMTFRRTGPGGGTVPLHYTFNTPVNASAANQCGRVVFSDFHVNLIAPTGGTTFPAACGDVSGKLLPMSAQEKIIEYMLLDLSSCISQDTVPQTCQPKTCAQIGAGCGLQGDGCGGQLNCGTCAAPQTCGGGGVPNQCGGGACVKKTCANYPNACGQQSDGCGGLTASCGACSGNACVPKTCANYPGTCGQQSDGCGGVTANCGTCPNGQTCGGGGVPNQCGGSTGSTCVPRTCAQLGVQCGPAGDGCGGLIASCGSCPTGQVCGGGGVPGVCGGSCTPRTCAQQNIECGPAGDGCGNVLQCGDCTAPLTCGGGGVPGRCGASSCAPRTCAQLNIECGPAGDGCGGLLNCGTCLNGGVCGGDGVPGRCSSVN